MPRLLAMLCILAVFLPSFFMEGAAQALFVPLSLAVGFAMVTSYLLSSTFVPVMSVWLLAPPSAGQRMLRSGVFPLPAYARCLAVSLGLSCRCAGSWSRLTWSRLGLAIWLVGSSLGTEIFPKVDSGQFQLRLRAADGTRIERTEEIAKKALDIIKEQGRPG